MLGDRCRNGLAHFIFAPLLIYIFTVSSQIQLTALLVSEGMAIFDCMFWEWRLDLLQQLQFTLLNLGLVTREQQC